MPQTFRDKILIIGSGPAGYTAAIYAARAALKPRMVTGMDQGGQLMVTTDVENYPGFADVIQGPWLMEQMKAQAEHVGTQLVNDMIVEVDFDARPFKAVGDSGDIYLADAVIIATGAQARWLGLPSEEKFRGAGVSACATCDGFLFRGKDVTVIGGGNTAVEEALYLTHHATKVTIVHRRDQFKAEKILQERLFRNPKIAVIWDHAVDEVLGTEKPGPVPGLMAKDVTGLRLKHAKTGALREHKTDGMFVAIGHTPATALFKGKLRMDSGGYLLTKPDSTTTDIPGVFAAGDVKDKIFRQAVTAAGLGCMAALEAEKYLAAREAEETHNAEQAAE